ncbi:MAG: CRISPR-associated RAMP protein Csx10 [Candidatus Roseilinea sp.]|nr:MAG: CRISPR-associated RAMP protein Csx10 [Candidatus Roseilinea sp.]
MSALTFTIELLEPLLIADPVSGDENSASSLDYIPGSVVRGALARAFTNGKRGDLSDPLFKKLFFDGARFLNAYPAISGERSLPTPLSWQRDKDASDGDPITDLANADAPKDRQLKEMRYPFVRIQPPEFNLDEDDQVEDESNRTPSVEAYAPERDVSVHIAQRDRRSAARSGTGDIYRYDALAPGQRYIGVILSEDDDALKQLGELLPEMAKLGKSRSAGYGAVKVMDVRKHPDWREYAPSPKPQGDQVVVTLLSDVILRDRATGGYADSLAAWLGAQALKCFARCRVVGGFNLAWGLPLPQAYAIQAGSVFVFRRADAPMERLQPAVANGIGERLVDGFGRIAIDWHTSAQLKMRPATKAPSFQRVTLAAGSVEHQLAQQMVDRIWRAQLDRALREAIGRSKIERPPTNAQLSRMRLLAREAWRTGDPATIGEVLQAPDKEGKNRKAMKQHARDQFERARIYIAGQSNRLLDWLANLAARPDAVWAMLQLDQLKRPEIGGVEAKDPPALEYMARLVDGVLRKVARQGGD